nr:mediator of RNA polymerase II transcription subunit 16 isoform X2 [Ipomoea batatas]
MLIPDLSFPGVQSGSASTQMQAWAPGVLLKSSNTADSVSSAAPNPVNGPSTFMPISINTGTFPGTPAVRLIGDCHFLHRLCQLLHFCFIFRRTQLARYNGPNPPNKVEEASSAVKPIAGGQVGAGGKGSEEGPSNRSRIGSGNAGQGYTYDEKFISEPFNFLFISNAGEGPLSYSDGSLPSDSWSGTSIAGFPGREQQHPSPSSLH